MQSRVDDKHYMTKTGIVRKKPGNKRIHTDPRLDYEFSKFTSFLRDTLKGSSDEKIEKYFDSYINRLKNIKEFTIKRNHSKEGEKDE